MTEVSRRSLLLSAAGTVLITGVGALRYGGGVGATVGPVTLADQLTAPAPRHAIYQSVTFLPSASRATLRSSLATLRSEVERLTANPLVSVQIGLGQPLFTRGLLPPTKSPQRLTSLPTTERDASDAHTRQGDLMLLTTATSHHLAADAAERLMSSLGDSAIPPFRVPASRRPIPVGDPQGVPRNSLGFHDGTANITPEEASFRSHFLCREPSEPDWLAGGSYLVVRQVALRSDSWSELRPTLQEAVIGRSRGDGRRLSPTPADSHVGVALSASRGRPPMLRRGYDWHEPGHSSRGGLLFMAYAADPTLQILPVLLEMTQRDPLNAFSRTIRSEIFALPGSSSALASLAPR